MAVLGWDSGGGCARILGKGGNLLRECGGARGFYLHVKHFSWIGSVAVSPVYRPAHPRVWPGQTVCWRQPPHISSQSHRTSAVHMDHVLRVGSGDAHFGRHARQLLGGRRRAFRPPLLRAGTFGTLLPSFAAAQPPCRWPGCPPTKVPQGRTFRASSARLDLQTHFRGPCNSTTCIVRYTPYNTGKKKPSRRPT